MDRLAAEIILTGLAAGFAGILLFIAEVLNGVFKSVDEAAFRNLMALLFRRASRSIVLTVTGAGPALGVLVYILVYGFGSHVFLLGMFVFWCSLVASNLINARIYRRIQASKPEDTRAIFDGRLAICRANWFRAALAAAGAVVMLVTLLLQTQ